RALQPFLKKHLPWKKGEIVIENIPGAAGLTGSREIFYSNPDGYTIGTCYMRSALFPQLLGQTAKFDLTKYTFLGQFANNPSVVFTRTAHPFLKTFLDMKNPPRTITYALSAGGEIGNYWMLREKVNLNVKPIMGYKGSREVQLAVLGGEVDINAVEFATISSLVKSGDLRPIFHYGDKPLVDAPKIPSLKDLGYGELGGKSTLDRSLIGPPNIPKERVEVLRKAIWDAMNDPQFIEWSKKTGYLLDVQDGDKTKEICTNIISFWIKYGDQVKQEMNKFGY
ncbi:MAG: tripartite tricarboxylate transporter substrate-binding protein, partial [Deltaproteobacteria bacterium]